MAVTALMYGLFPKSAWSKEVHLTSDNIKVMLLTSSYTPSQDTHQYKSSVVANEVTGTGYTAGGATLASTVVTYTTGTNTTNFDAADTVWSTSTITARYAVVYDSTPGSDATRPLICYVDFGADVISTSGNFTIVWDATGIIAVTVA